MSATFYIRVNGTDTALDLALAETCQLDLGNQVMDWLRLQTTEALAGADQWEPGTRASFVMIEDAVETILFSGTFTNPAAWKGWSGEGKRYLIKGPWDRFERTPYTQPWTVFTTPGEPETEEKEYARVFLWNGIGTAAQIAAIVDFLIADQVLDAGLPEVDRANLLPIAKGTIDADCQPRPVKAASIFCAEAVLQSLRLLSDAVAWWDYSTTTPVFHCRRGAALTAHTQALGDGEEFEAVKQTELLLRYVRIAFKRQNRQEVAPGEDPLPLQTEINDALFPVGYAGSKYGGFDVAMDATDNFTLSQGQAIAQLIYEQAASAVWSGRHTQDLNLSIRPGLRYNVSGSRADYAAMNSPVQSVSHDFAARTTTVSFGPPRQLAPQDFLERLRGLRNLLPTTGARDIEEQETGETDGSTYGMGNENGDPVYATEVKLPDLPVGIGPFWLRYNGGGKPNWQDTTTDCS